MLACSPSSCIRGARVQKWVVARVSVEIGAAALRRVRLGETRGPSPGESAVFRARGC